MHLIIISNYRWTYWKTLFWSWWMFMWRMQMFRNWGRTVFWTVLWRLPSKLFILKEATKIGLLRIYERFLYYTFCFLLGTIQVLRQQRGGSGQILTWAKKKISNEKDFSLLAQKKRELFLEKKFPNFFMWYLF